MTEDSHKIIEDSFEKAISESAGSVFVSRKPAISRKQLLQRAAALGLSAPTVTALLADYAHAGGFAPTSSTAKSSLRFGVYQELVDWDTDDAANSESSRALLVNIVDSIGEHGLKNVHGVPTQNPSRLLGSLAQSWAFSPDATSLTIKLRNGLKFSDGSPLTADDVVWSWQRNFGIKGIGSFLLGVGNLDSSNPATATNTQTVIVHFKPRANSLSLAMISELMFTNILNSKLLKANATVSDPWAAVWLKKHPENLGSGPLIVDSWSQTGAVLKPNPNYWGGIRGDGPAKTPTIQIQSVTDPTQRALLLRSGAIDGTEQLLPRDIAAFVKDKRFEVWRGPSLTGHAMTMNVRQRPFKDVRVRRAMNYAVNRELYAKALAPGLGSPFYGSVAKSMKGAREYYKELYPYDPEKATSLLKAAGYGNGFSFELAFDETVPIETDLANALASDLAKLRIHMTIKKMTTAAFYAAKHFTATFWYFTSLVWDAGYYAFFNYGTSSIGTSNNRSEWGTKTTDALLKAILDELNPIKRQALLDQFQKLEAHNPARVPIIHTDLTFVFKANVSGVRIVDLWPRFATLQAE